jgi:galactokinase
MDLAEQFFNIFGRAPVIQARAPGRVNLLGEHVDYNDGYVLPAAIDRQVTLAAAPTQDRSVTLAALDLNRQVVFSLDSLKQKCTTDGKALPSWAGYPAGVAWSLEEAGLSVSGMQAAFTSDVPIGAGLSSSAAVEVAFATAWQALAGWKMDCLGIARLCQRAENQYVGVNCGLMDQFASACGVAGHAMLLDTRSLAYRSLALPPGTAIVIADSGIRRSLANSAYNERRAACERAVAILQEHLPGIQALRDISTVEFAAYSLYLPEEIRKRTEHVVMEIYRVQQAVTALRDGDSRMMGGLMYAGHQSLKRLYEVSLPELDILVEVARNLPGVYGARLTGAGFGGCTVNFVEEARAAEIIQGLIGGYRERTGRQAQVYLCHASAGASVRFV